MRCSWLLMYYGWHWILNLIQVSAWRSLLHEINNNIHLKTININAQIIYEDVKKKGTGVNKNRWVYFTVLNTIKTGFEMKIIKFVHSNALSRETDDKWMILWPTEGIPPSTGWRHKIP